MEERLPSSLAKELLLTQQQKIPSRMWAVLLLQREPVLAGIGVSSRARTTD
jgi:hypothetical protein|tara:strand:- start:1007 stop:1159 length:153 start_codon:yes stop_codon:yes gene_type:complete